MKRLLLTVALIASSCHGQAIFRGQNVASGITNSWTIKQVVFWDSFSFGTGGGACLASTTTCVVTLSAVTAGDTLVAVCMFGASGSPACTNPTTTPSESWTTPTSPHNCAPFDAGTGIGVGCQYSIAVTGGETSLTCNMNTHPGGYFACAVFDISWSGSTVTFDFTNGAVDTSCTSCAGQAVTITGSSNAIIQVGVPANTFTSLTGSGYTPVFYDGVGLATRVGTTDGTAPTWTQNSAGVAIVMAITFKGS